MQGHIREREEITHYVNLKNHTFAMTKHTNVINDWWVLVVRWLFMSFFYHFLVLPIKKSDMSLRYKRQS